MENENYMQTSRLEAFYDAIIAIIVTVLVLELPQPETASIAAIWALRNSYFAYLVSFLVCTNVWQYHHVIYNHVERVDSRIIWLNIGLLLIVSIIPYLTTFTAAHPFSLLAQVLYGVDFILMNVLFYVTSRYLIKFNPDKLNLKEVIQIKNALVIPSVLFIIGLIIAFMGYPIAISICCLITIIRSIIYSLK
ncbi:MAG: TMEM175 family protein [Methanobrevibacter sp.]|nr:TMEM175 family protein [Methanobrevibacter sp.]